jgi:hypothetical protein
VFSTLQELDMYESWQEQLYDTITSCKRVMTLITPAYLKSTSCSEQYNIALCLSRKLRHNFLIPLYLSDVSYMPTYMGITQYIDCRYGIDLSYNDVKRGKTLNGMSQGTMQMMFFITDLWDNA